MRFAVIALALLLGACVEAGTIATKVGDSAEAAADIYRENALRAVKGITIGAWSRERDPVRACGAALIAGFYDRLKSCDEWPQEEAPALDFNGTTNPTETE